MSLPSFSEFAAGKYVKQPIFFSNVDGGQSALALDLLFSSRISEAVDFCVRFSHTPHLEKKNLKTTNQRFVHAMRKLGNAGEELKTKRVVFLTPSLLYTR